MRVWRNEPRTAMASALLLWAPMAQAAPCAIADEEGALVRPHQAAQWTVPPLRGTQRGFATSVEERATLAYEFEGFDLETGVIECSPNPGVFPRPWDFHFGFHADRENPTVFVHEYPAEIVFLDETPFFDLDDDDVPDLVFSSAELDVPFDRGDTVVIRTTDQNIFKIGVPTRIDDRVTFSYRMLVPETQTGGLIVAGVSALLLLASGRPTPQRHQER